MRLISPLLAAPALALLLAGCATPAPAPAPPPVSRPVVQPLPGVVPPPAEAPPPVEGFRTPDIMRGAGLDGVIREGPNSLIRQFGTPRLDVTEGDLRKLQFAGTPCVLDVFLYPLQSGGEPRSTWLEARRASDGEAVDLLACMQALREGRGRRGDGPTIEGERE
ncbi:MAG: hypothetical protein ABIT10_13540 [Alteraurantiacibacter sp.]